MRTNAKVAAKIEMTSCMYTGIAYRYIILYILTFTLCYHSISSQSYNVHGMYMMSYLMEMIRSPVKTNTHSI